MAKRPLPSPELLRQLLRYEPATGKLFWRERPLSMFADEAKGRSWNTRYAEGEAFTNTNGHGYKTGTVLEKSLAAHRVIVAMETGKWPYFVDHDDRNKSNNRWKNLRDVTPRSSRRNQKKRANNSSGINGVCWEKRRKRWHVRVADDSGKIRHIGYFRDIDAAAIARAEAEARFSYHPNNGR